MQSGLFSPCGRAFIYKTVNNSLYCPKNFLCVPVKINYFLHVIFGEVSSNKFEKQSSYDEMIIPIAPKLLLILFLFVIQFSCPVQMIDNIYCMRYVTIFCNLFYYINFIIAIIFFLSCLSYSIITSIFFIYLYKILLFYFLPVRFL